MDDVVKAVETLRADLNISHRRTLALIAEVEKLARQGTPALLNAAKAVEQARAETKELAKMYKRDTKTDWTGLGINLDLFGSQFWQNLQNMQDDLEGDQPDNEHVSEGVQRELHGNQTDDDWFARLK